MEYYNEWIIIDWEKIELSIIEKEVNKIRKSENDLIMVTLSWDWGRWWDWAEETFICPRADWIKFWWFSEGKECYLWEIAWKHSEIYWTLDDSDVSISEEINYNSVGSDHSLLSWMTSYFEDNLEWDDFKFVIDFVNNYGDWY